MKRNLLLSTALLLASSYVNAASVHPGDATWMHSMTGMGEKTGSIVLTTGTGACQRGCTFAGSMWNQASSANSLADVLDVDAGLGDKLSGGPYFKIQGENMSGGLNPANLTPVPIPPTAWLFASALVGLAVIARRKKSHTSSAA